MSIPNILTIFRIFLIPIFITLFFAETDNNLTYAFIVFFIAGITDILDGYIARRFNMVSDIGKVLDPLADKMMLISVLICLASIKLIPIWLLIIVMLKELTMVYGGIYLYFSNTKIIIPSNKFGKLATIAFYLAITLILLGVESIFAHAILYFALLTTGIAFFQYLFIALKEKEHINRKKI